MGTAAERRAPPTDRPSTTSRRTTDRDPALDAFRGLAVLLMAVGNFELGVRVFPDAITHTVGVGYTVADLVAPMFVLAIGFTVGPSMQRRRAVDGAAAAYRHLVIRGLSLIGIGAVISAGQAVVRPIPGRDVGWGVLQALGGATLLLVPVVLTSAAVRATTAVLLLVGYQWMFDQAWADAVLHTTHNGLPGVVSWGALLMLATVVADGLRRVREPAHRLEVLAVTGVAAVTAALVLATRVDISKDAASPTYMLLSLGLALLVLAAVEAWVGSRHDRWRPVQRVGRNALLLYLGNLLLLGALQAPGADWWYAGAALWLSLLQAAVVAGFTLGLATFLDRRGIVVAL